MNLGSILDVLWCRLYVNYVLKLSLRVFYIYYVKTYVLYNILKYFPYRLYVNALFIVIVCRIVYKGILEYIYVNR